MRLITPSMKQHIDTWNPTCGTNSNGKDSRRFVNGPDAAISISSRRLVLYALRW